MRAGDLVLVEQVSDRDHETYETYLCPGLVVKANGDKVVVECFETQIHETFERPGWNGWKHRRLWIWSSRGKHFIPARTLRQDELPYAAGYEGRLVEFYDFYHKKIVKHFHYEPKYYHETKQNYVPNLVHSLRRSKVQSATDRRIKITDGCV